MIDRVQANGRRVPTPPKGETFESIRASLSLAAQRSDPRLTAEFENYLSADLGRFLMTLDLVPQGTGRLLEIGADPYFTTLLLDHYRDYDLTLANGGEPGGSGEAVLGPGTPQERSMRFVTLNIEDDGISLDDGSFDVILFCEVLEHLTVDPLMALSRINRLLKPDGVLVLTTPNAARLANAAALFAGNNMYDRYSAYGPYGRHNREYVLWELRDLLAIAGFDVRRLFAADYEVAIADETPVRLAPKRWLFDRVLTLLRAGRGDVGFTLFAQAVKKGPPGAKKPRWLYRSYPDDELLGADETVLG
ncbi:MAG: methyltransferase domain-containing protein [Coriobacteriia bacterium]